MGLAGGCDFDSGIGAGNGVFHFVFAASGAAARIACAVSDQAFP